MISVVFNSLLKKLSILLLLLLQINFNFIISYIVRLMQDEWE